MRITIPTLKPKHAVLGGVVLFLLLFLLVPTPTYAVLDFVGEAAAFVIGKLTELIASFLGWLLVKLIHILVQISAYNNFAGFIPSSTGEPHPVEVGWKVVRDFSNLFFILILLVIAFATMFRVDKWNYRTLLPRLLVMSILINFSRTIVAFIIDAAQVVMLTFVNAFQEAAGGNFIAGLGIQNLFQIPQNAPAIKNFNAVASFIFADMFLAIAVMVVLVICATLAWRIVALWMITIMAPAAFLLSTFPRGQKHYGEWWDQLICWALSGPVLAFFLWLALATMASGGGDVASSIGESLDEGRQIETGFVTEAASEANMVKFLIGIAMLLFGLQASQQFCGVGVGMAQGALSWAKQKGVAAAKGAAALAGKGAWATTKGVAGYADYKTDFRRKAYGVLGYVPGARDFAAGRISKIQEGASKAAAESKKRADVLAKAAPEQLSRLADRGPITAGGAGVTATRESDAAYGELLRGAIMSEDVYESDVKAAGGGEKGKEEASRKRAERYKKLEEVAKRSGNPDTRNALKEVRKEVPHLIQDDAILQKVVGGMGSGDAIKMDDEALADPRVYAALTPQAREYVEKRGSAKQRVALARAASRESGVTRLTAGEVGTFATAPEGKANLSRFFDSLATKKTKGADGKDTKDIDPDARAAAVAAVSQGLLDPSQMRAQQFMEDDGEVARIIGTADTSKPEVQQLLVKISQDEKLASGLGAGAATYRNKHPDRLLPEDDQKLAEVQFITGSGGEVFKPGKAGQPDQLKTALTGRNRALILKAMTQKKLQDPAFRATVAKHIDFTEVMELAKDKTQEDTVATIIEAIREAANGGDIDAKSKLEIMEKSSLKKFTKRNSAGV